MKKTLKTMLRVMLLTLLLSMSISTPSQAAVARPKAVYDKAVKLYENKKFKKAQKYFDKMARKAHEASVKKMDSSMKTAYLNVLNSYVNSYGSSLYGYYLTDIDKDKKPELIVDIRRSEATATGYVYSYLNGRATQMGSVHTGHSVLYYDPRGNGMTVAYGQMGYEKMSTVKISYDGRIVSEDWKIARQLSATEDYLDLPLLLDNHMRYTSAGRSLDYSPLR